MQDWFEEEWLIVQTAISSSQHEPEVIYQLITETIRVTAFMCSLAIPN